MSTTIVLTRRDLYDRVWSTPLVKLAPELGMSAPELAKLCKRNGIPLPESGHWMITRAGYEIERDPLPTDPPPETHIQITGDLRQDEEEHPDVSAQIVYEAEHSIVVPDHLNRPHRLVARTKEFLRPQRQDAIGAPRPEGGTLSISVSPKQLPRALRIFDSLLKACEERDRRVDRKGSAPLVRPKESNSRSLPQRHHRRHGPDCGDGSEAAATRGRTPASAPARGGAATSNLLGQDGIPEEEPGGVAEESRPSCLHRSCG